MDVVFNDTATHESYTDWHTLSLHGALPDCGSGAVQCAAALGLWQVLRRENIDIDMVVGCSGGSIYASVMALGYDPRSEEHTSELQSLMRISYAVFCLKKTIPLKNIKHYIHNPNLYSRHTHLFSNLSN